MRLQAEADERRHELHMHNLNLQSEEFERRLRQTGRQWQTELWILFLIFVVLMWEYLAHNDLLRMP